MHVHSHYLASILNMCACIKTSAEDNDYQRLSNRGAGCGGGGLWGRGGLMILFNLRSLLFRSLRYSISPGQFRFDKH